MPKANLLLNRHSAHFRAYKAGLAHHREFAAMPHKLQQELESECPDTKMIQDLPPLMIQKI